jgi:hypothetical protein
MQYGAVVLRLVVVLVVVLVILALAATLLRAAATAFRRRDARPARRAASAGGHEWDSRRDQLSRQLKGVSRPPEDRDGMLRFLDTHEGVEAYVEPRTMMHPLSAVLIDADGASRRFELREDAYLRELARTRGLRVYDATRVGYPERMRRRSTRESEQGTEPPNDRPG